MEKYIVERIHEQGNLNALHEVGSTIENLKETIAKEANENKTMYSSMLEQAVTDHHKTQFRFENMIKSKNAHAQLYFSDLSALEGRDFNDSELYFCPFCGNILSEKPDKVCSVCSYFYNRINIYF